MAGHRDTKRNRRSRSAKARRRVVGLSSGVGAFLTLGLGPLANAPKATADEFDVVIDQVLNAITGSLGDVAAGSAAVPELGSLGLGVTESAAVPRWAWVRFLMWARWRRPARLMPGCKG